MISPSFTLMVAVLFHGQTTRPAPNQPNEKERPVASVSQAVAFLDAVNQHWTGQRKCGTCHTNYPYLMTRRAMGGVDRSEEYAQVRSFVEKRALNWAKVPPTWDAEVVSTAAALLWDDHLAMAPASDAARAAWDRMWKVQKADGGFSWLKCNWPPAEHDDYYGAIVAGMAVMVAPQPWQDQSKEPIARLTKYLRGNQPDSLHHDLLRTWVLSRLGQPLDKPTTTKLIQAVRVAAKPEGGWSLVSLGSWKRHDGTANDAAQSPADGYGTAMVIVALEGLAHDGVDGAQDLAQKGRDWLHRHQKESGRWFTRSPSNDKYHYMTHAGTAWAAYVLAKPDPKPQGSSAGPQN